MIVTNGKARNLVGRFMGDRKGNIAVLAAMSITTVAMAVGFGINLTQAFHVKSGLLAALDAAVTSTARDITTGVIKKEDARAAVEKFLQANADGKFADGNGFVLDALTTDDSSKTLEATAHAVVDSAFPLFGYDPQVSVTSAALYSDKKVEIAMMLDVTGSMAKTRKTDKIGDLKTAAENAVKAVLDNQDPRNPRIRVALVPYASAVNAGDLAKVAFAETGGGPDLPPQEGHPLLVAKTGQRQLPDFETYVSIVRGESLKTKPNLDNCATERKKKDGSTDFNSDGPDAIRTDRNGKKYYALINRDDGLSGTGMNKCPDAKLVPLTADKDSLLASIGEFKADGYTGGAIAIQWTYYMLSNSWAKVIEDSGLGDGPAKANAKKIAKVAILMTDGQFNTAFAEVGGKYNSQGRKSRDNAQAICKDMKESGGIEVFTIGFDLNNSDMSKEESDEAKAVLKNCASPDTGLTKHYFEASTGAELDAAFQEIVRNTEKVALTK